MRIRACFFIVFVYAALVLTSTALTADFAADPSIDVEGLLSATKSGKKSLATFSDGSDKTTKVAIYGDLLSVMSGVPVLYFTADMDVDCDGVSVSLLSICQSRKHI